MSVLVYFTKMCQEVNMWTLKEDFLGGFLLITIMLVIVQSILIFFLNEHPAFYCCKAFRVIIAPISWVISPLLLLQPPHLTPSKHIQILNFPKHLGRFALQYQEKSTRSTIRTAGLLISLKFFTGCMVRGQVTILLLRSPIWWYHSLATVF